MNTQIFSLEKLDAVYEIEHDWLFEKLPVKLNVNRQLILEQDQGWDLPAKLPGLN